MLRPPRNPVPREHFDPTSQVHLDSFDVFLKTGNWGAVQFFPELPYSDVPMTVLMKYAQHQQGVVRESDRERNERWTTEKPHLVRIHFPSRAEEEAETKARIERGNALLKKAV